jgi:hypothetical protein
MKIVDLGNGAVGIEPEGPADRIESVDLPTLRNLGVSEKAIASFSRYVANTSQSAGRSITPEWAVPAGMRK